MRFKCWLLGCKPDPTKIILVGSEDDYCLRCGAFHLDQYLCSLRLRLKTHLPYSTRIDTRIGRPFDQWGHRKHYDAAPCGYLAKVDTHFYKGVQQVLPFSEGETVFIFGDIDQMPGHCVLVTRDGRVHWGYHTGDFVPLMEEEA